MKKALTLALVALTIVILTGCDATPKKKLTLDLTTRRLETDSQNTDTSIGKIEYEEKTVGEDSVYTKLTITAFQVAQQEAAIAWYKSLIELGKIAGGVAAGIVVAP